MQQDRLSNQPLSQGRKWPRYMGIAAAALCVVLLVGAVIIAQNYLQRNAGLTPVQNGSAPSLPPPEVWRLEPGQTIAHNASGTFAIEYIDLTSKEFRFFYVLSSSHQETPHIEVVSYVETNPHAFTHLVTTVQPLGRLGSYAIGVIHASLLDRAGQFVAIQVTLPATHTPAWQLAPLRQLLKEPDPSNPPHYDLYIAQNGATPIIFNGPVMKQQVAYFKDTASHYIFLRLDNASVVQVITREEYVAIAGPPS